MCESSSGWWGTYSAAIASVDSIDQIYGKVVLVRFPVHNVVAILFQCIHNSLNTAEDGRVRKNLKEISCLGFSKDICDHLPRHRS